MISDKSTVLDELRRTIRDVNNFPKAGIVFKDVTPVLLDAKLFAEAINLMVDPYRDARITRVVAIYKLAAFPTKVGAATAASAITMTTTLREHSSRRR